MMPLFILTVLFALLLPGQSWAQSLPAPLTRIAFGSCADEEKPQPIWDAVLAYHPELFLFTGDNVYGDVRQGRNVPDEDLIKSLQEGSVAISSCGQKDLRAVRIHLCGEAIELLSE
jgi:hypothetical protein